MRRNWLSLVDRFNVQARVGAANQEAVPIRRPAYDTYSYADVLAACGN